MTAPHRRLPLWQAALWVLLGGALAQVAGAVAVQVMRARLGLPQGSGQPMTAQLVVPALLASAGSLLVVGLGAPLLAGIPLPVALNLRRARPICFVAAAVGTVMLGPVADGLMRMMQALWPQFNLGVVEMLHDLVLQVPLLQAWPAFALLPGIAEELLFRGVLQTSAGPGARAIVISAVSFALFHLDPHHVAGVLPLGFFLAWVASRCGTWVTIFAHVVNNSMAIALTHSAAFDVGYGTDEPMPWQWLPASLAIVAISGWAVVRGSTSKAGIIPVSAPDEM